MSGPGSPRWPGRIPPGRRWTRWTARAAVGKLADLYATKLGDFAEIITGEMGSPITFSQLAQAPQPQMMLSYFADLGKSFTWEDERPGLFGPVTVHREPVGVVAAIVPWNVPQFTIIWYVAPTVFADVDPGMRIAREEIFGPVLAVIPYEDESDAVAIANDSDYGLAGTVWTADIEHGMQIARRVRAGTYGVNMYMIDTCAPFGGYKASGIGRELGPEGLMSYLEYKSISRPGG
jgi:acyl-CoA reductase-like NAD-dependent aldehyde dehydrogenase